MNDEFERMLEASGHGLLEELSQYLPGGTVENHKKPQVRMASLRAEI
jgi:hypothetical protein